MRRASRRSRARRAAASAAQPAKVYARQLDGGFVLLIRIDIDRDHLLGLDRLWDALAHQSANGGAIFMGLRFLKHEKAMPGLQALDRRTGVG